MFGGIKTTEFWLTILTIIVQVTGVVDLPKEAIATVIAYVIGRSVKKGLTRVGA